MHREIQSLVAHLYGPEYRPHPSVAGHLLRDLPGVEDTELTSTPVIWVDTGGSGFSEALDPISRSLYNPGEINVIALAVAGLRQAGLRPDQIGVIAPYSAQVARLKARPELREVEVSTVDGFQGREKEAVLCTFVRTGEEVGFLQDPRRLTVALTRGRRLWMGVGDASALRRARPFVPVLEALEAGGAVQTIWAPPWDAALS